MYLHATSLGIKKRTLRNASVSSELHKKAIANAPTDASTELVHVVQTRFMQDQSDLLELGLARLELFETFCLPSILAQTNKNFLWVIRTDPDLHPSLLSKLLALLEGRPRIILIGSNYNPEGFGRGESGSFGNYLRADNQNRTEMSASILSGDHTLLEESFANSASGAVLLETRLDADDGLHRDFVKTVQQEAKYLMRSEGNPVWRIWCISFNIEWHPLNPFPASSSINKTFNEGYLVMYSDPNICVTPGLTFGYSTGADRSSISGRLRHDEITRKVTPCTPEKDKTDKTDNIEVNCFSRLANLSPGAVRSRTTTSAGMDNVVTGIEAFDKKNKLKAASKNKQLAEKFNKQFFAQDMMWNGLHILFSVSRQRAKDARKLMMDRMQQIAEDK